MSYTRREFGKLAFAGLPAAALLGRSESIFGQAKPNSLVNGVQLGAITYSYRDMPDQSAEATLKYVLDSGISAIELMGGPVESFAGAPTRGAAVAVAAVWTGRRRRARPRSGPPPRRSTLLERAACTRRRAATRHGRHGAATGTGERRRRSRPPAGTRRQAEGVADDGLHEPFKKLADVQRRRRHDLRVEAAQCEHVSEEYEYISTSPSAGLHATTLEILTDPALLKRVGDFAERKKIYAAYHTHAQGSMTAFDQAFAISKGNTANVDFGHWVAAGNVGGTPMQFLEKHHARISSFHVKDRTTPEHCSLNLPFGKGETPIKEILQLVKKNKWKIPASIEMEYDVPEGSDPSRKSASAWTTAAGPCVTIGDCRLQIEN